MICEKQLIQGVNPMIRAERMAAGGHQRQVAGLLLTGLSLLLYCLPWPVLHSATLEKTPSGDEILARMVDTGTKRQAVTYSWFEECRLHNLRFEKEAVVFAQVTYSPNEGKLFTVLERQGSPKLAEIVEKVLATEAEASRAGKLRDHEIGPSNYVAILLSSETRAGRACYVLGLTPKRKRKYLIKGTVWVDRDSYDLVRLEGVTSTSVSMWAGSPNIQEEFSEFDGLWLPIHALAVSSTLLLGTSELEIRYKDYKVVDLDRAIKARALDLVPQPRP
jgi:hypothetical protein